LQPLDRNPLTKDDKFFDNATTGAAIVGSGQTIYWKDCTIKVYKTGEEWKVLEQIPKCDGQAIVKKGTSLLLEGGKVKKE